jgi:hypothetical protein
MIILFWATDSFSQDKGYVAISLGTNIPIGDFASSDANNKSAGYATTGGISDISFAYKFGENFGMSALIRGQANPTDAQSFADEIAKQFPGSNVTVDSKTWGIGGLMFGGYGSFPISEKVSFDTRAMIGFLNATSPDITVTLTGSGGSAWVKMNSTSSTAFSYLIGAGFKYDAGRKVCLFANIDYLGANPEFKNVETTDNTGATLSTNTFSQSFGTISFSIGIGLRL